MSKSDLLRVVRRLLERSHSTVIFECLLKKLRVWRPYSYATKPKPKTVRQLKLRNGFWNHHLLGRPVRAHRHMTWVTDVLLLIMRPTAVASIVLLTYCHFVMQAGWYWDGATWGVGQVPRDKGPNATVSGASDHELQVTWTIHANVRSLVLHFIIIVII